MAAISVQVASKTGAAIATTAAAAGGDTVINDGETALYITNGSGASITVTINEQTCNHGYSHSSQVVVPAGASRLAGPFPVALFGQNLSLTYSAVTSLTVGAVSVR